MTYGNIGKYIDSKTGSPVCDLLRNPNTNTYALRDYVKMTIKEYKTFKRACRESQILACRWTALTGNKTTYINIIKER